MEKFLGSLLIHKKENTGGWIDTQRVKKMQRSYSLFPREWPNPSYIPIKVRVNLCVFYCLKVVAEF